MATFVKGMIRWCAEALRHVVGKRTRAGVHEEDIWDRYRRMM